MIRHILPIMIDGRKIIFLSLKPERAAADLSVDAGEDEYIVEVPFMDKSPLFSISKKRMLQSLVSKWPDASIDKLSFKVTFDKQRRLLDVSLRSDSAGEKVEAKERDKRNLFKSPVGEGLELNISDQRTEVAAMLIKNEEYTGSTVLPLTVRFSFYPDALSEYSGIARFHIVKRHQIQFVGFDFGSEASQVRNGYYDPLNAGDLVSQSYDLFKAMKRMVYNSSADLNADSLFHQFEDGTHLYKSEFYVNKKINGGAVRRSPGLSTLFPNSIKVLTRDSEDFDALHQIPNLKIIHGSRDFADRLKFTRQFDGKEYDLTLADLKEEIYSGLLEYMVRSYLSNIVEMREYLRFTLLVPNIYSVAEIIEVRLKIRKIIEDWRTEQDEGPEAEPRYSKEERAKALVKVQEISATETAGKKASSRSRIKAFEVSTLSESDASFLGCLKHVKLAEGNYYIVVDCGKGTTDFSIIQSEPGSNRAFKPVYRSGFAGAGNLITFAFVQTVLFKMMNYQFSSPTMRRNMMTFLKDSFPDGPRTQFSNDLYKLAEGWKKNYSPTITKEQADAAWNGARVGERGWETLFATAGVRVDIVELLHQVNRIYDWNGYIQAAVAEISSRIRKDVEQAVSSFKSSHKCGGILLTGRGFNFNPLKQCLLNDLHSIPKLKSAKLLNNENIDPKAVCMQGVFERSVVCYSDTASSPIQFRKGASGKAEKKEAKLDSLPDRLSGVFKFVIKLFSSGEAGNYNYDSNVMQIDVRSFQNLQFLAGGKLLEPQWTGSSYISKAHLIQAREGIFLRVKEANGEEHVIELHEPTRDGADHALSVNILKSLYPGLLKPSLLGITS